ncbi:MAG: patatin-like phospholipase family protein [Acidobacteriota bacterium]|nr:patatin-like phospholipase family protein [Acidobacteriota bacterium]
MTRPAAVGADSAPVNAGDHASHRDDHPHADGVTRHAARRSERALVLHGGGSAGNAWEIGVIAGLHALGVDLTSAELIVGTSAGATAAAQITGAKEPGDLLAAILAPPRAQSEPRVHPRHGLNVVAADYMSRSNEIIARAHGPADMRRSMGAAALAQVVGDESVGNRWRATVAARLPSLEWPAHRLLIVAVDAESGEPVVFDRHSGVDLADAVAASCANGFGVAPYAIGERRYIDGGYRRNENADLAAGYQRVLVLSPFSGRTRHPLHWGMQLAEQISELRAAGSRVEAIFPDERSRGAFGANMMDPSTRPPAARAGYDEGRALAEDLRDFWC